MATEKGQGRKSGVWEAKKRGLKSRRLPKGEDQPGQAMGVTGLCVSLKSPTLGPTSTNHTIIASHSHSTPLSMCPSLTPSCVGQEGSSPWQVPFPIPRALIWAFALGAQGSRLSGFVFHPS